MPVVALPEFNSFETIEAVIDTDEYGAATARVSYYARTDEAMLSLLREGVATCPLVAAGMLQSARFLQGGAESIEGGVWQVNLSWVGLGVNLRLDEAVVPGYSPIAQTSPIETHPLFEGFAGTPEEPLNGAFFDAQHNFVRFNQFLPDGVTPNPKSGMKSYYDATLKVSERRGVLAESAQSEIDNLRVGKIDVPDIEDLIVVGLDLPGIIGNRDHLFTSLELDDMGNDLIMMSREWDMSGPFGWDKDIYDYADTGDASTPTQPNPNHVCA